MKEANPRRTRKKPETLEEMVCFIERKKDGETAKPIAASLNVSKTHLDTMYNRKNSDLRKVEKR